MMFMAALRAAAGAHYACRQARGWAEQWQTELELVAFIH